MGFPCARMTDTGFGNDTCHSSTKTNVTGTIIQGASKTIANGLPIARMTDIVMRGDGHSGVIIGGSGTVLAESLPVARMLDSFVGCFSGIILDGSTDVIVGD